MTSRFCPQHLWEWAIVALVIAGLSADTFAKPIRLQNETILPSAEKQAPQAQAGPQQAVSGLFLVQLREPPSQSMRNQLDGMGVELQHYVPEDTFVARMRGAHLDLVRSLPFVTWIGEYGPQHKIHKGLAAGAAAGAPASFAKPEEEVRVAVLLARRVSGAEISGVRGLFKSIRHQSAFRDGTIMRGKLSRKQLDALSRSGSVIWIEPDRDMRLFDEISSKIVAGDAGPHTLLTQSLGYDGAGVAVAVADSGLHSGNAAEMHPDLMGRTPAFFWYGNLEDASDEHSHGTHVAGIIAGDGATGEIDESGALYGLGVAPGASIVAQRLFDGVGNYEGPPFETMTRDATRAGAVIGSNSWGDDTQGRYDLSAFEFDGLVRDADLLTLGEQQYILEFSAGNAGPGVQTIGSPAVAKNVIATGASQNERYNLPLEEFAIYAEGRDAMADFSSRGPCADGRIKPDVVAPGTWIASLRSVYADDNNAWWPISQNYLYQGGTSQAGPQVSGAAAIFVQYWRATHAGATPSPALVKAALINTATDMDDGFTTDTVPNNDEGWGRVDLPALIDPFVDFRFTDQSQLLTQGAVHEQRVLIGSAESPLKITLTYTDVPGNPAAGIALVNDLDLEVRSPDGRVYRGNSFENGESVPNAPLADNLNNVEGVHLSAPVPGEYVIRIKATRVVEDARRDTSGLDQDFALVISGIFAPSGSGLVTFDRPVYRAPDVIKLALVDYDLAGQPSATVLLRSGAEPAGESIMLQAMGSGGVFTGQVASATGPALANAKLEIADGNVIEAVYADAAPPSNRVFSSRADLRPAAITQVTGTSQFGQIAISWHTDEDTSAELYYGVVLPNEALTNQVLLAEHEFTLVNVPANATVKFYVVAQDEAGNRSTNNNSGAFFTVVNVQPPSILLADSFGDYIVSGFLIASAPPLSGYTNSLNQLGVAYDVFDARSGAVPSQAQLNSYRCVIWRVSDLEPPNVTLAQRISTYVSGGGSLFLASMEAVSRFTEAQLASFNRDILRVQSYSVDQVVADIAGAPGEAIGNGISTALDYTPYAEILALAGTDDPSDWIVPTPEAAGIIVSDGHIVGLRAPRTGVDLPGRVVFLAFPLDAVPEAGSPGNNRAGMLQNALNFLAPSPNAGTLALDREVYSLPGRAIVELDAANLTGQGVAAATVSSPQQTNQLTIALSETSRAGLFRGVVFFSTTNNAAPGTYAVSVEDFVNVNFFDASAGINLNASATFETNAPVIADVFSEPGYLEAVISWTTSEPADSLVQYSESPVSFPINFTTYDPSLTTDHEILLTGLKPDTHYYFQVTSRDRAGNATLSGTNGAPYSFTTLLPLTPPWSDDLEVENVQWSTFAPVESESQWTLGAPGGGETANSGTNCWGSNLAGGQVGLMETYLITPGIYLEGGNKATLRFWHNYDFLGGEESIQLAAIEIITNITAEPVVLMQMPEDFSGGWEFFEFDLTPYLGNVAYIVWYHFLFSMDMSPRMGWLVDDVSITVDNVQLGSIKVTNNLWQAVWSLSGPSGRPGNGRWTVITNAAPGTYVINYGDALYHTTPTPQTNTLAGGGTLTFTGIYNTPDVNTNGIPDSYEIEKFGVVDPNRSRTTDTDRDLLPDYAEFVGGTDPNNPPPPFRITARRLTAGMIELSWPSITNLAYRVWGGSDPAQLAPYTDFFGGAGTTTAFNVPATNGAPHFFRVEAMPPSGPNTIPGVFRVTANHGTNGSVRLGWPTAPGHGYRVLGSSNGTDWSPFSDWLRASTFGLGMTLPARTNGAPNLFRVEAQP